MITAQKIKTFTLKKETEKQLKELKKVYEYDSVTIRIAIEKLYDYTYFKTLPKKK